MELLSGLLASQLAIGGLVGFLMGFALKKMAKIVMVLAGMSMAALLYLEHNQFVSVNYEKFELALQDMLQMADTTSFILPTFLTMNVPLLASFGGAMAIGFKKG
ncbi:MAG: FUN14 domain-containing protein [Nitrososphaerales archaeon]